MKIISETSSGFKIELTIPESLKREGMSDHDADKLINIAYKPTVDKIAMFLAYAIGRQDLDSIKTLEDTITNIAIGKIQNR